MRILSILLSSLILAGCAGTPYKELNLDTSSRLTTPINKELSGIYVYQWKTGFIGAALDVDFEIKGEPVITLNTGEYAYFEIKPGQYEYKLAGGLFGKIYAPVEFEPNKNYFFSAQLQMGGDTVGLVRDQLEIDEAKENILTGRYEIYSED